MKYSVALRHARNPDIGGYWQTPVDRSKTVRVESIREASEACRAFISRNGLGGGNWTGGIVTQGGVPVAYISYNGRAWKVAKGPSNEMRSTNHTVKGAVWHTTGEEWPHEQH
jgi:hypothetical protein